MQNRTGETAPASSKPLFNDAESPLSWLRTRRDRAGRPLITDSQYMAGERLRADFERALMVPRTTMNWDAAGAGGRTGNVSAELSDGAIAARGRYIAALEAVGPELASILAQVCCLASGLEQAERVLNLPQRSGKAVLGLALTALARHYGLLAEGAGRPAGMSQWGLPDYRPGISGPAALEEA
ncbi:DUF6456 domain-containing protein [Aestuariivirga sp.]|uniref:DUF6456 domain-containing protein n=1 Tax=Aestuariivirga sp. TaxID=2650926 RepID=UPI00391C9989